MKKLILAVLVGTAFSGVAHAGFSIGMTGAFKKQAAKLDKKVLAKQTTPSAPTAPTPGAEWVLVPGNPGIGTSDFYVMKYEVKNVGGIAASQATVTPWVNISQADAVTACSALGSGSHLLTIAETQTINRNIEAQAANWANGIIGSLVSDGGGLKRGNVDVFDSVGYTIGSAADYGATPSADRILKAKLVLSNGGEIWDWSGNVSEWIYGDGPAGTLGTPGGITFYTGGGLYEWNIADLNEERPILGPLNAGHTYLNGMGSYYGAATTEAVIRGGSWQHIAMAGIFTFYTDAPSSVSTDVGFRCGR